MHEKQPGLLGSKVRLRLLQRSVAQTCWIPLMLQCLACFQDSPQLRAHLILNTVTLGRPLRDLLRLHIAGAFNDCNRLEHTRLQLAAGTQVLTQAANMTAVLVTAD